jgi:hypothetical protein
MMVAFKGPPGKVECQQCRGPMACLPCSIRVAVSTQLNLGPAFRLGSLAPHNTPAHPKRVDAGRGRKRTSAHARKGWMALTSTMRLCRKNDTLDPVALQ